MFSILMQLNYPTQNQINYLMVDCSLNVNPLNTLLYPQFKNHVEAKAYSSLSLAWSLVLLPTIKQMYFIPERF